MDVLCINCEHQTKRKDLMLEILDDLCFPHEFLTATYWKDYDNFDAMLETLDDAPKSILEKGRGYLSGHLNLAALIASFSRAMVQVRDSKKPAIICVDDMAPIYESFDFDLLANTVKGWEVISFWVHTPLEEIGKQTKYKKDFPELLHGVGGCGDNALMMTPNGAAKLLSWFMDYAAVPEEMLRYKAAMHKEVGYIDPNHYYIMPEDTWFRFTEHYNESDTGLSSTGE